jgi:uncharacterized membrane protein
MSKGRLEAFSDGVFAVIITIMVLNMNAPRGTDLQALKSVLPVFLCYVLSYIYVGIYWNNHHHLLHASEHVTGGILWANLYLTSCFFSRWRLSQLLGWEKITMHHSQWRYTE